MFVFRGRHDLGFSLTEVLTALAIVSVAATLFLMGMNSVYGIVSNYRQDDDIQWVMESVYTALNNDTGHCSSVLSGLEFDPRVDSGTPVPAIKNYNELGEYQNDVVIAGQPIGSSGLIVQSLVLKPFSGLTDQTHVADLELTFAKQNSTGPGLAVRSIPVFLVLNAGRVQNCSTSPIPYDALLNRMCDLWYNGYAVWDPVNKYCVDTPDVEYTSIIAVGAVGSSVTVQCPPNMRLAASRYDRNAVNLACWSSGAGVQVPERRYLAGMVDSYDPFIYVPRINFTNNSCTFYFPIGSDLTNTWSEAKCTRR